MAAAIEQPKGLQNMLGIESYYQSRVSAFLSSWVSGPARCRTDIRCLTTRVFLLISLCFVVSLSVD